MTMDSAEDRGPLTAGRGLLRVEDFCAGTGLDRASVDALVLTGRVEGVLDHEDRAVGLFDDTLPTRDQLRALGLTVHAGYLPAALRSFADHDAAAGHETAGTTWTMSWEDGDS